MRRQCAPLPFPLRFSINADWPRFIPLGIRPTFLAIKNVIGADMNESRVLLTTDGREQSRRFRVDRECFVLVSLATIDICLGGSINQEFEFLSAD